MIRSKERGILTSKIKKFTVTVARFWKRNTKNKTEMIIIKIILKDIVPP